MAFFSWEAPRKSDPSRLPTPDFEDNVHIAVTVEDDPGRDLGEARQPGHRFFFSIPEVEPLDAAPEHE